jgi:hypothetical protein
VNQAGSPVVEVSLACRDNSLQVTATQQRFFLDPAMLKNGSPERWQVPLCLKSAGGAAAASCEVLSEPRQVFSLPPGSCSSSVFANAGAQGYFRTAYNPESIRAIAPRVQELNAPERLSLLGDEWAMVRANLHGVGEYLTLATGFGNERAEGVLSTLTGRLDILHEYVTTTANRGRFEAFVRTLLSPLFQQVGRCARR